MIYLLRKCDISAVPMRYIRYANVIKGIRKKSKSDLLFFAIYSPCECDIALIATIYLAMLGAI